MNKRNDILEFVEYVKHQAAGLDARCRDLSKDLGPHQTDDINANLPAEFPSDEPMPALSEVAWAMFNARRTKLTSVPLNTLFQDPAWDILLDLYIAQHSQKCISIKSASLASNAPMTTALRHVWHLESLSLIERYADAKDRRRHFIQLTRTGLSLVERILRGYEVQFRALFLQPSLA